jgi:hypothetical protein
MRGLLPRCSLHIHRVECGIREHNIPRMRLLVFASCPAWFEVLEPYLVWSGKPLHLGAPIGCLLSFADSVSRVLVLDAMSPAVQFRLRTEPLVLLSLVGILFGWTSMVLSE